MTDTYVDGGGVLPDQPLPAGTWVRINSGAPNTAITIYADGNGIRVVGHYLPVNVERIAANELRVTTTSL